MTGRAARYAALPVVGSVATVVTLLAAGCRSAGVGAGRGDRRGATSEGISERVFVRTPEGWRIAVSTAFALPAGVAPPPVAVVGGTLLTPTASGVTRVPNGVVV